MAAILPTSFHHQRQTLLLAAAGFLWFDQDGLSSTKGGSFIGCTCRWAFDSISLD
jgi:hypothetical protein